jgi:hypothetical protein
MKSVLGTSARSSFQALGSKHGADETYSCEVTARPVEAVNEADRDRVIGRQENDRYRTGCPLCNLRRDGAGFVDSRYLSRKRELHF